jgi:DNA uptake protein ComE-like DNA-binding protein
MTSRRGSALIVTLWSLGILSLLAFAAAHYAAIETRLASHAVDQLHEKRLIAASLVAAQSALAEAPVSPAAWKTIWSHDPKRFEKIRVTDGVYSLERAVGGGEKAQTLRGLEDEESRINLNVVPADVLKRLPGMDDELAAAIIGWRGSALQETAREKEENFYKGLSPAYEPKKRPLQSLDELLLVRGMTPELLKRLAPYVTIYGEGRVNINTASSTVLAALGMTEELVIKIDRYRRGADGLVATEDDGVFASIAQVGVALKDEHLSIDDVASLANAAPRLTVGARFFRMNLELYPGERRTPTAYTVWLGPSAAPKQWTILHASRRF